MKHLPRFSLCAAIGLFLGAPLPLAMSDPAVTGTNSMPTTKPETDAELRKRLTPLQYAVTRENETEAPFTNPYWKTHDDGIYVDIVSGKPLFSSKDKFDSDCGWPAFTKPISNDELKKLSDQSLGMDRMEVRSNSSNSHLGHVFDDGPPDKGGLRYCINSAAMRFIPKSQMAAAGYGAWLKLFDAPTDPKKTK